MYETRIYPRTKIVKSRYRMKLKQLTGMNHTRNSWHIRGKSLTQEKQEIYYSRPFLSSGWLSRKGKLHTPQGVEAELLVSRTVGGLSAHPQFR